MLLLDVENTFNRIWLAEFVKLTEFKIPRRPLHDRLLRVKNGDHKSFFKKTIERSEYKIDDRTDFSGTAYTVYMSGYNLANMVKTTHRGQRQEPMLGEDRPRVGNEEHQEWIVKLNIRI